MSRFVVNLVIGCALGVAPVAFDQSSRQSSRTPSLRAVLEGQMAPLEALAWSSTRPLAWTDFKGPPVTEGDEGAHTAYSLFSAARCVGRRFEFQVIAAILPNQSWVKPVVLADHAESVATLRHEQTHFNLSEVFARRMRKYFNELYEPCRKTETELDALAQAYVEQEAAMQHRYDEETRNGRIARKQAEWDADVAQQLASLSGYLQGVETARPNGLR